MVGSGNSPSSGRVEVCIHGRWSTVCDDLWSREDAQVVCRQLGFPESEENGLAYPVGNAKFSPGSGFIGLDQLECAGTEQNLLECPSSNLGSHNCDSSEDAGVYCPGKYVDIPGERVQPLPLGVAC